MGFFPGYSRHGCFVICTRAWSVYACVCVREREQFCVCVCVCVDLVCCITILLSVVFFISKDVRPHGQLDMPPNCCLSSPASSILNFSLSFLFPFSTSSVAALPRALQLGPCAAWKEDTQSGSNYIKLLKRQQLPATKEKDTAAESTREKERETVRETETF